MVTAPEALRCDTAAAGDTEFGTSGIFGTAVFALHGGFRSYTGPALRIGQIERRSSRKQPIESVTKGGVPTVVGVNVVQAPCQQAVDYSQGRYVF